VSKTFRPYQPRQSFLLPPSPQQWLPEKHLAYFVMEVVEQLDLGAIYAYYNKEERGFPPHHPLMMVALLLYAYCVGVPSSRKIENKTQEDIAFRVIAGNTHPDHSCISEFRRIHLEALTGLFVQVLRLCQEAGLVKLGHVAIDGTKVKANASKHKAMSYDRMKLKQDELCQKVQELMEAAEQADQREDAQYGKGLRGDELPKELERAESRRARIRELMEKLEAEAREQKQAHKEQQEHAASQDPHQAVPGPSPLPVHQVPADKDGVPTDKAQRNFTDGDSRIMKMSDGFVQGYNCQIAVDAQAQIIVAQAVTNQPPDAEHLLPLVEQVVENCGRAPAATSADAGYFSENNVVGAYERGTEPFIATGRTKHEAEPVQVRGRPKKGRTVKEAMGRKLATRAGRMLYGRRKVVAEPPFGQIKNRGFRQFLLRGQGQVRSEWALITMTHNVLKLHGATVARV
jgi:transposase